MHYDWRGFFQRGGDRRAGGPICWQRAGGGGPPRDREGRGGCESGGARSECGRDYTLDEYFAERIGASARFAAGPPTGSYTGGGASPSTTSCACHRCVTLRQRQFLR